MGSGITGNSGAGFSDVGRVYRAGDGEWEGVVLVTGLVACVGCMGGIRTGAGRLGVCWAGEGLATG